MKTRLLLLFLCVTTIVFAQKKDPVIEGMIKEANENSQLEVLVL